MICESNMLTRAMHPDGSDSTRKTGLAGCVQRLVQSLPFLRRSRSLRSVASKEEEIDIKTFCGVFEQLGRDKELLDQTAKEIEQQFLAMGTSVQELATLSDNLLSQSERLADSIGSEFETHLRGAFEVIGKQLEFVQQYQGINTRLVGQLADYLEKFQRLSGCQDDLDRILSPMRTVCVLFKINSVSLENEERSFFESLTDEISALQRQASTKFGEQISSLVETGQRLGANIPELKEQACKQAEKVDQKKIAIEESMRALQNHFTRLQSSHEHLSQSGKDLKAASGGAILGLQYQDITRQKWEHVAEALEEMCRRGDADGPLHEKVVFFRDVSRIQIRQVEAIQADLSQAQEAVGKSVNAMLERLRGMDEECQQIYGKKEGTVGVESMVKELLDGLAEARVWVAELSAMAQMTCATVSSFDKTASDVAGTLRRLSINIGMMALNAQVQVARIGHENGLDVLSEFICTSSNSIKGFSETVGAELDRLVGELHETIIECRHVEEKTKEEQRWLEDQGTKQEAQLKACRQAALDVQDEVTESLEKIHERAEVALGHSDFRNTSQSGFKGLRETLRRCADLAEKNLDLDASQEVHQNVHDLKKSYTMESEREVFEAIVAEKRPAARGVKPAAPVVTVPKREDAPVKAAPSSTPKEVVEPVAANRSITPPELAPVEAKPAEPKPELGDNVELF